VIGIVRPVVVEVELAIVPVPVERVVELAIGIQVIALLHPYSEKKNILIRSPGQAGEKVVAPKECSKTRQVVSVLNKLTS